MRDSFRFSPNKWRRHAHTKSHKQNVRIEMFRNSHTHTHTYTDIIITTIIKRKSSKAAEAGRSWNRERESRRASTTETDRTGSRTPQSHEPEWQYSPLIRREQTNSRFWGKKSPAPRRLPSSKCAGVGKTTGESKQKRRRGQSIAFLHVLLFCLRSISIVQSSFEARNPKPKPTAQRPPPRAWTHTTRAWILLAHAAARGAALTAIDRFGRVVVARVLSGRTTLGLLDPAPHLTRHPRSPID